MKQSYLIHSTAVGAAVIFLLAGCASAPTATEDRPPVSWRADSSHIPVVAPDGGEKLPVALAPTGTLTEYFGSATENKSPGAETTLKMNGNVKMVEMNFQDADVRSVIGSVLGDMLKLNYSIDPAVQGKITLRTGRPILPDSALPALEAALTTVSAAVIVQGQVVQVVPLDGASQRLRGARRIDPSQRQMPGFAIEIVPLRYVGAKEIQRVLESFAPKGTILQADELHNHLVIAGTSQDRAAVVRTIEGFDTDAMQGMSFAIYKVEQTDPDQLVSELKQIFLPPLELITQRVRLVSIPRMQSILGISKYRADLEMLETWIRKLDGASKAGGKRLYVYNVQNGSAKDLAKTLQLVVNGETLGGSQASAPTTKGAASSSGDTAAASSQPVVQISQGGNQSRIVANEENNSLLVFSTEQEYRTMRDALRQLDVMPRQVMIEALLAEVTLGDNLQYGVQWLFNSGENTITLSGADSGSVGSQFPGFSYIYSGVANARLVLNALRSKTDVKILSSPKLAVLNNQKAELLVGDQVPILTQESQGTAAPGAPIVTSIQMRDTGVSLEVTPRISDNGNVILDVTQEVSDVSSTTTSGIDSPTITRRRLHSVIATRDGATVALGGLIRESKTNGSSGIPGLSSLPVIGNLFGNKSFNSQRTELIVLLVPHVMRDQGETQSVVDALLDSMPSVSELTNHAAPAVPKQKK